MRDNIQVPHPRPALLIYKQAGGPVAGAGLAQQRLFCFAALDGFRAARVEPAAGRRLERAGHIPF